MKKNFFKKWVAMLGTISLLTNVFLPWLEVFANDEVELNCETIDGSAPAGNQDSVVAKLWNSCYTDVNLAIQNVTEENNVIIIQKDTTITTKIVVDDKTVVLNLNWNKIDWNEDGKTILLKKWNLTITNWVIDAWDWNQVINVCWSSDSSAVDNAVLDITEDVVLEWEYWIILRQAWYWMCENNAAHNNKGYWATINFSWESSWNIWVLWNITEWNSVINIEWNIDYEVDDWAAVAWQWTSTININDGAEISWITAIEVARATLNINWWIITATGTPTSEHFNNNWTTIVWAAIAIAPYTKSAEVLVNINSWTISSQEGWNAIIISNAHSNSSKTEDELNWELNESTNVHLSIPEDSEAIFSGALKLVKEFVEIKWWTFSDTVPTEYLSSDASISVVDAEAKIWNIEYKTLADAIEASKDWDTIGLLKDVEVKWESYDSTNPNSDVSLKITNKNNITIEWQNNTVKYDQKPTWVSNWANFLFKIYGSTVTLSGLEITNSLWAIIIWENSNVTLNNVNLDWNDWYWIDTKSWLTSLVLNNVTRTDGLIVNNDCKIDWENNCEVEPLWNKLSWTTLLTWVKASEYNTSYTDEAWYVKYSYIPVYTIKFVNEDWKTVISEKQYAYWTLAANIVKPTATKASDSNNTYTFKSWTPEIADVTTWATYKAVFTSSPRVATWGGGGGGSSYSAPKKEESKVTTWTTNTWSNNEEINLGWEVKDETTSNVTSSNSAEPTITDADIKTFWDEQIEAYKWAFKEWITTMDTVEKARLDQKLTRAELAKMMVVYIQKVKKITPLKTDEPKYSDVDSSLWDLADYIKLAYQYQIMGIDGSGNALNEFNPNGLVTRAEYATVFSRVLFWSKYNQSEWPYYEKHIAALKAAGILTKDDPTADEYRGWVMLMMYRSANTPLKATNETAKEETKAEEATWAVAKIANPASTYCVEQGWEIEIKEDSTWAQYGVCKFKDGTEVEEWEYFRANHKDEAATWTVAESATWAVAATWTVIEAATGTTASTWAAVEAATWATASTWEKID